MPDYASRAVASKARGPWDEKIEEFKSRLDAQRRQAGYPALPDVKLRSHIGRYMKHEGVFTKEGRLRKLCELWSICCDVERDGKYTFSQVFWARVNRKPAETQQTLL